MLREHGFAKDDIFTDTLVRLRKAAFAISTFEPDLQKAMTSWNIEGMSA